MHDVGITIRLGESHEGITEGVNTKDNGDSRAQENAWNRVGGATLPPLHTAHVAHIKPRLIDIKEGVACLPQLNVLKSPLLAQYQVLWRVRVVGCF